MKKSKRVHLALAVILLISIALTGCNSGTGNNSNSSKEASVVQVSVENHPLQKENYEAMNARISEADFAFSLGQKLLAEDSDENFVYSPLSVWLPLAALVNATDEENKPALLEALGAGGVTEAQINEYAQTLLYRVTNERHKDEPDNNNPLKIANALFVSKAMKAKQSFAQSFADYYQGTMFNVDFTSKQAVEVVNKWASDHTEGLITNVIDEFDPATVAAIANAIYYSNRWIWEFDEKETKSLVFHKSSGDTKAKFMKREGNGQPYYEDDRVQVVALDFSGGGRLWIILPKNETANELYASMTADYFFEILRNQTSHTGTLLLPKFEIVIKLELRDALIALGIPLFDGAPLTGGLLESDIPVWLSKAIHKAMIKVDEKGTTAAAVTVMTAEGGGFGSTAPFEMTCDKPFVFVLEDYNQMLFTGVVNNPADKPKE